MEIFARIMFWIFSMAMILIAEDMDFIPNLFVAIPIILMLQFFVILVYEAGHALAVVKTGGRLRKICVVMFEFDAVKRKFGWARVARHDEIGCFVSFGMDEPNWTSKKDLLIASSGPAASFLLSVLLFLGAAMFQPIDLPRSDPSVAIASTSDGQLSTATSAPVNLPSEAQVERVFADLKARQQTEFVQSLAEGLMFLAVILSLALGLLNLIPFRGSDGNAIKRAWSGI